MSIRKHSEAHIVEALKQVDAGRKAAEVDRDPGISKHTIHAWKVEYGVWRPVKLSGCGNWKTRTGD